MAIPVPYLTVEKYLTAEQTSPNRHEYIGGQIFAMAGGSKQHNQICLNIASLLRFHVRGTGCTTFMSDMKVKIPLQDKADIFYYPDVVVTCNQDDKERFFLDYPCLIIEVLSPGTEAIDKREKRINYQTLNSLQEYILVSQDEIRLEVYRKNSQGIWIVETLDQDDKLQLDSVGLTLTMQDIYEDVFDL
ncbi:MAG: Uma2 family endonuclease [Cyanobacteria bacterium P01_F01_bin.143]